MKKVLLLSGLMFFTAAVARAQDKVDFEKQIRPIFADTCYKCHAGTKHKGDFKLDNVASIKKGGKDGDDVVPGHPEKSGLFKRITLKPDDDDIMPPSDKGKPLAKAQTDLIKAWIVQGADFGAWKQDTVTADAGATSGPAEASAKADGNDAPPQEVLPQAPAAAPADLEQLKAAGAQALPVCQGSNLLTIEFVSSAATTTDQQIDLLAKVAPQLYDLNLAGTKISDDGLKALDNMSNLRRLHLEKTAVTDAGLSHLKNLNNLEYLNLYHTSVSDAGLAQLQGLKKLKNVYLWQSKVTDEGAETLKKALPTLSVDMGWKEPAKAEPAKETTTEAK
jgi:hypothetical protein